MNKIISLLAILALLLLAVTACQPTIEQQQETRMHQTIQYRAQHDNESDYCKEQGAELNNSYDTVKNCHRIECFNLTGMATYQFCNPQKQTGVLIAYTLFPNK
jgi:hypothetical protein